MSPEPISQPNTVAKTEFQLPPSADGSSFELYCRNSAPMCAITLPDGARASDFGFSSVVFQLPHAVLLTAESSAHRMSRGKAEIAQGIDHIMLMVLRTGHASGICGNKKFHMKVGDIAFFDYTQPYESLTSDYQVTLAMIARDRVPPVLLHPSVHGTVLPAATTSAQMLNALLAALMETINGASAAEVDAAIDGYLLVAAAALERHLRDSLQERQSIDKVTDKALAFIDRKLLDVELAPSDLETGLKLSRATLYRLFEPFGGVRAVITRKRLDRVTKELLKTTTSKLPLGRMARNVGFRNEQTMVRAFRARFGLTPRAFHMAMRSKDRKSLIALANKGGFASFEAILEHLNRDLRADV